jgi:anti-sigma factor RsiW
VSDHVDSGQLSRLIDGDLSLTSREAVMAHLRDCARCAQRHDELIAVAASLRLLPPVEWSTMDTDRVVGGLEKGRRRWRIPVSLAACVAVCLAAVMAATSLTGLGLALGHVIVAVVVAVSPAPTLASSPQLVWVIMAVAILAPLAAYPLARWR